MTVTAAQVSATTAQLSRVASWLEQAGAEHATGTTQTRAALAALPSRWRGPAAQSAVEAGRHLVERAAPVSDQLLGAVREVRRTVDRGNPVAENLWSLERQHADLQAQVRTAAARAAAETDPVLAAAASGRVEQLQEQLRWVLRRQSEQQQLWLDVCRLAARSISEAAGRIRAVNASVDLGVPSAPAPAGGGAGGRLVDRLRELLAQAKNVGSGIKDAFEAFDIAIKAMYDRATAWRTVVRQAVVVRVREVRAVVGRFVYRQRELLVDVRRLEYLVRGRASAWLSAARTVAGRAGPAIRMVGRKIPFLSGALAGWERWDKDAQRSDLTSTERWLRTGLEGGVRGYAAWQVGAMTLAVAKAVGVATLPIAWLTVPLVVGVGAGVGLAVDRALEWLFDLAFDRVQWTQEALRWAANGMDDVGRGIRAGATAIHESLGAASSLASDTWAAAEERWLRLLEDVSAQARDHRDQAARMLEGLKSAVDSTWSAGEEQWAQARDKGLEGVRWLQRPASSRRSAVRWFGETIIDAGRVR